MLHLGVLFSCLSAVGFTVQAYFVKRANADNIPSTQLLLWRCLVQLALSMTWCLISRQPLLPKGFGRDKALSWLWITQGSMLVISFTTYVGLCDVFTLGVATTIFYISPIYSGILGRVILKDPYTKRDLAMAVGTFLSLFIACFDEVSHMKGKSVGGWFVAAALFFSSPISYSLGSITLRKISHQISTAHTLTSTCFLGLIIGFLAPVVVNVEHIPWGDLTGENILNLIGTAIFNGLGFIFLHLALRFLNVGTVILLTALEVPLVFVVQVLFLDEPVTVLGLVGTALVLVICSIASWLGARRESQMTAAAAAATAEADAQAAALAADASAEEGEKKKDDDSASQSDEEGPSASPSVDQSVVPVIFVDVAEQKEAIHQAAAGVAGVSHLRIESALTADCSDLDGPATGQTSPPTPSLVP